MSNLTQERLKEFVEYDPLTGLMARKIRAANSMPGSAPSANHSSGYVRMRIDNSLYFVHRLAWLYVYGEWPDGMVDHINRDRADNRINNLRIARNQMEQQQNKSMRKDNASGYPGVFFDTRAGKWQAVIYAYGKRKALGFHDSPEDAFGAYKDAKERLHKFSPGVAV